MENREDPISEHRTPIKEHRTLKNNYIMQEEVTEEQEDRAEGPPEVPEVEVKLVKLDQSLVHIAAKYLFKFSKELNPKSKEKFKLKNYSRGRSNLISHQNINYYSLKEGILHAGVAFGIDFKNFIGEKGCRIMSLFINHIHRGKGYSKILMNFYIERAKRLKFRRIKLDCYFDNDKAQRLYHKLGFKLCSELYIGRSAVKVTNYEEDKVSQGAEEGVERSERRNRNGENDLSGDSALGERSAESHRKSRGARRQSRLLAPGSKEHNRAYYMLRKGQRFVNLLKPSQKQLNSVDLAFKLLVNKSSSPFPRVLSQTEGTFTGPSPATLYIVDNQDPSIIIGMVGIANMTSPSRNRFIPHVTHILVDPKKKITETIVNETVESVLKICLEDWRCYEVLFEVVEQKRIEGCIAIQDLLRKTFSCYKEYCGIYEIDFEAKH